MGEIADAFTACKTKEEAQAFVKAYEKTTEHARANLGYMLGYFSSQTRAKFYDWCDLSHPIFGKTDPTPEEALAAGKRLAGKQ